MLSLDIGDIGIKVVFDGENCLGSEFDGFLSERGESSSTLRLKVHKRGKPAPDYPNLVDVYTEDGRVIIKGRDFEGYLDLDALEGEMEIPSEESFESFLRVTFSLILPNNNGIVIHASSLARDGKAYVFPGKSGVGKTTIAKSSPDATLLTDEISIIRGIGEKPIAYGTPFHGNLEIPGENTCAPIAGLYFPVKDRENYLEKLNPRSALEKLLPNVVFFGQDQEPVRKVFYLAYELVASLPCYDLHFRPDPSFWSCIDEQEGRG